MLLVVVSGHEWSLVVVVVVVVVVFFFFFCGPPTGGSLNTSPHTNWHNKTTRPTATNSTYNIPPLPVNAAAFVPPPPPHPFLATPSRGVVCRGHLSAGVGITAAPFNPPPTAGGLGPRPRACGVQYGAPHVLRGPCYPMSNTDGGPPTDATGDPPAGCIRRGGLGHRSLLKNRVLHRQ